jgi:hypothetical protein
VIKIKFEKPKKGPKQSKVYWAYCIGSAVTSFSIPHFIDTEDTTQYIVGIILWFCVIMAGLTGMLKHDSRSKKQ